MPKIYKRSYGPALYILLELFPNTVMFMVIIVFDIPFTSGAANGSFLRLFTLHKFRLTDSFGFSTHLYSKLCFNSIDLYTSIFLPLMISLRDRFLLWRGSSALDMLAIHYITLVYSLLLVVPTVKIINTCNMRKYCCDCCFKMWHKQSVRGSITHGLTTFLLPCYSHYAQISLMILISGTVYGKDHKVICQVVFYDGEVYFLSNSHLIYAMLYQQ